MEKYYSKALVPVDGSSHADMACRHAIALAESCKLELLLLHCFGDLPATLGGESRELIIHELEKEAKSVLAPYEALCREQNMRFTSMIRPGAPGRTIVHVAREEKCDLIVMGSRGLSEFSGMVLGSVSHRVLRHAEQPVLLVR